MKNSIDKKELDVIKEYYNGVFPNDVQDVLDNMIEEEIENQETKSKSLKIEIQQGRQLYIDEFNSFIELRLA